jgi:hypothetical protein
MLAPITKVNEGESNTPCPSTLEVTYSSVEKLSKTLRRIDPAATIGRHCITRNVHDVTDSSRIRKAVRN